VGIRCADHATPSIRKSWLALTSPTSGGRSVGRVRLQTKAMEFRLAARDGNCHNFRLIFNEQSTVDYSCQKYYILDPFSV
jgi:hypothetical protein